MGGMEAIAGEGLGLLAERGVPLRAEAEGFASMLDRSVRTKAEGDEAEVARQTRAAAEEFVAIGLVQPILASMRELNQAAEPFAAGAAERRFGPMLDAEIAQRIVRSANFGLVDSVARQLLRAQGMRATQESAVGMEVDRHG